MTITFTDPPGLPTVGLYRQVAVASGSKLVFVAGQVAVDASGALIGAGDLAAQTEQCYLNVADALAAAGGSWDDVAKLTIYLVDWTPDKMPQLVEGIARASSTLALTLLPPITGVGVTGLAEPGLLIEVDAIAVLT